jgi:hypothetical protein
MENKKNTHFTINALKGISETKKRTTSTQKIYFNKEKKYNLTLSIEM